MFDSTVTSISRAGPAAAVYYRTRSSQRAICNQWERPAAWANRPLQRRAAPFTAPPVPSGGRRGAAVLLFHAPPSRARASIAFVLLLRCSHPDSRASISRCVKHCAICSGVSLEVWTSRGFAARCAVGLRLTAGKRPNPSAAALPQSARRPALHSSLFTFHSPETPPNPSWRNWHHQRATKALYGRPPVAAPVSDSVQYLFRGVSGSRNRSRSGAVRRSSLSLFTLHFSLFTFHFSLFTSIPAYG